MTVICDFRSTKWSYLSCHIKTLYELFVLCANKVNYFLSLGISVKSDSSIIWGEEYYTNMKFI